MQLWKLLWSKRGPHCIIVVHICSNDKILDAIQKLRLSQNVISCSNVDNAINFIEHEIHSCWNHLFLIILRYTFHFSSLIKWFLIINFSPATCSMFKCSNFNVHNRIYCTCSIPFVAIRGKSGVEIWQQRILTLKQESIRRFEYGWGISVNEFKNIRELFWRSNFSSLRHT